MRQETMQNKMLELLGLDHLKVETDKRGRAVKKKSNDRVGVSESEIAEFRAAQGLIYFLQAPELFTAKTCPHCKEAFLVSRQFVAFCSYTCIAKDLESRGITWSKGQGDGTFVIDEAYIRDVWEGNEPIWVKNLDRIQAVLASVKPSLLEGAFG